MNLEELKRLKHIKKIILIPLGAILGYGYYYFIGCTSGTCPITGNPYIATIYGALFGFVLSINGKQKKAGDGTNN